MTWFYFSFFLAILSSRLLISRAERWGFMDIPEDRKVHVSPTPRTGGLAMVVSSMATVFLWLVFTAPHGIPPWQTLVAGSGFILLGTLDDRFGFHPRRKFLWFSVFAAIAAWPWAFSGPGTFLPVDLGGLNLQVHRLLAYPLIAFWFLAVPNAVNIEDAINGYMGGFTLILMAASALSGVQVAIPMGALAAFLFFNWPRAKHFLGDAGSFGCGFMIAEVLLRAGGNHRPLFALLLTAPISIDVLMGIVRRRRLKMSLFEADRSTFPHHVMNLCGQSHLRATPILWANTLVFTILAFNPGVLAFAYVILFAIALTALNRKSLFQSTRG